jgi:hypothetical protein
MKGASLHLDMPGNLSTGCQTSLLYKIPEPNFHSITWGIRVFFKSKDSWTKLTWYYIECRFSLYIIYEQLEDPI